MSMKAILIGCTRLFILLMLADQYFKIHEKYELCGILILWIMIFIDAYLIDVERKFKNK